MFLWITLGVLLTAPLHASGKCCENGDCYSRSPPFDSILIPLPACAEKIRPVYQLFTRTNSNNAKNLDRNTIPREFNESRMTIFIVHGYRNDYDTTWIGETKNALLNRDDVNVVVIGWGNGANTINYLKAASNTRVMAAEVAHIIANLVTAGGATYDRMWCVGHSLGAHVCGQAGKRSKLGRITGLDPAGPLWDDLDIAAGLVKTDADYVEVVHTHGLELVPWGTMQARGHTDFYPNGGRIQPGCLTYDLASKNALAKRRLLQMGVMVTEPYGLVSCSHSRAYALFIESIKQACFVATYKCTDTTSMPAGCVACENCPLMGYDGHAGRPGLFYLRTTGSAPFCI